MSSTSERRLEAYMDEHADNTPDGMSLRVENEEGGGNNVPDESEFYESRREWLEETHGGKHDIWRTLAKGNYQGEDAAGDDEELVFIRIPAWYIELDDNENFQRTFGEVYGWYEGWALLNTEQSEGNNAWCLTKVYTNGRWRKPRDEYGMLWPARSCMTVFRREGEPRPVDKARIREREALPDDIDPFDAEEDDYEWRLALGAAYRRTEGQEEEPLKQAYNEAKELPDKLYDKVEAGVNEFMAQAAAENKDVDDDELAMVVRALTTACQPGGAPTEDE